MHATDKIGFHKGTDIVFPNANIISDYFFYLGEGWLILSDAQD